MTGVCVGNVVCAGNDCGSCLVMWFVFGNVVLAGNDCGLCW